MTVKRAPRSGRLVLLAATAVLAVAACAAAATPSPSAVAATASPAATAPASTAASPTTSAEASAGVGETYTIAIVTSTSLGKYLTGEDGKTLYTFKPDGASTSTCSGDCPTNWPPFVVEAGDTLAAGDGVTGTLGQFVRDDGSSQATYNGHPLYYFSGDAAAGDTNGQGLFDKWFVAAP